MFVQFYLDDTILIGKNAALLHQSIDQIASGVCHKDLGRIHYSLAVKVNHFSGGLFAHQAKHGFELSKRDQIKQLSLL